MPTSYKGKDVCQIVMNLKTLQGKVIDVNRKVQLAVDCEAILHKQFIINFRICR